MRNLGPFETVEQAITRAEQIAQSGYGIRYVVYEAGEFHVADDADLGTWFMGIRDDQIWYCTAD